MKLLNFVLNHLKTEPVRRWTPWAIRSAWKTELWMERMEKDRTALTDSIKEYISNIPVTNPERKKRVEKRLELLDKAKNNKNKKNKKVKKPSKKALRTMEEKNWKDVQEILNSTKNRK